MDIAHGIWTFLSDNWASVATGLWFISEALASIPSVQANSIFQVIHQTLERSKKV